MEKDTIITTESNNNNNNDDDDDDPTYADTIQILDPFNHLISIAAEKVVPIQYPIEPNKYAEMNKLLYAEHNVLLAQGISKSRNICTKNNSNRNNT